MDKLNDYRDEIDKIDKVLIELFEKRLDVVLKVAEHKKENNLTIYQEGREKLVLKKVEENIKNDDYLNEALMFFESIMDISKSLQDKKNNV
jgi:chorismate mutase/prephenate dehydratase